MEQQLQQQSIDARARPRAVTTHLNHGQLLPDRLDLGGSRRIQRRPHSLIVEMLPEPAQTGQVNVAMQVAPV